MISKSVAGFPHPLSVVTIIIKVNWQAMQCHHIASFIPRLSHSKEGDNLVHFIMYNVKGNVRRRESLGQDIRTLG